MTRFRVVLAVLTTLVLSACYPPTTSRPVGSTAAQTPDAALTGTWKGRNDDGKEGYIHFLRQSDGSFIALLVETGPKAEDWNTVTLTTARLGGNRFMNAKLLPNSGKTEDEAPAGTVPVLYRIDAKGVLTLALPDEDRVKAAIKGGKIKGTVGDGEMGDAVITADAATLDGFLRTPTALALFQAPFMTLKKVD